MTDDKTGDELPPLTAEDREIIGLAREHAPVVYTNRHFPDSPSFSFPTSKLLTFARAYAAAAVAREREQWEKVSRISIPTKTMEQEIAARVRRAVARERELCAMACDARDMGDGSREDQEARRCAEAIRKGG